MSIQDSKTLFEQLSALSIERAGHMQELREIDEKERVVRTKLQALCIAVGDIQEGD